MADISVHIFLQNLKELVKSQHPNIAGEKDQLECLYKDLFLMSSFLEKLEKKFSFDNEKVNNLVTEIREVVFQAEYIVDCFVVDELSLDLKSLEKQIEKVKIGMDQINSALDQSSTLVGDVGKKIQKTTKPRDRCDENLEAAVGIDETIEKILTGFDGDQEMEVISVVGLPGIGKTTLAEKVFEYSRTISSFQVRAWVTVSQTYSFRQLLIDILQSSSLYKDSDAGSSEDRLGEDLLKRLKDKKYLIVLDDIWSIEAWNGIQRSFPSNHNGSKVLYTSRFAVIGKDICRDINIHNLCGLSTEHSWNLLKNKVFGGGDCPPTLERFGRTIAKKCDGLPLAIVVIAGILAKKEKTTEQWKQVAERLAPAIATDREAYMDTIALSYQHLPIHLKACFLYLGSIFPEDYEIPVRRLVWLLVAEGFTIQENNEDQQIQNSEGVVEAYLNDLVERSLVIVSKKRSCGATKTIRIHDLLRDFCLVQGEKEKFILKRQSFGSSPERKVKGQCRLLAENLFLKGEMYLWKSSYLKSLFFESYTPVDNKSAEQVFAHSFRLLEVLQIDCEEGGLTDFYTTVDNKSAGEVFAHSFRLLKVLQVDCEAGGLMNKIEKKVHLRYLALTSSFDGPNTVFTSSVTKLLYLETLILHTREDTHMPDGIWNMVKLRHLYNGEFGLFHFQASPSQGANRSSVLPQLQSLRTLCACKTCLTNLVRFPNLKKLGLKGNLISECGYYPTIPDLGFLEQLVTLKVYNSNFYCDRSSTIFKLRLPACLRKLTLQNTFLKWEEILVLAELENLEVLKLLDNACADTEWDTSDVDFPKLKYLKMQRMVIEKWDDSNLQFESLEVLELSCCRYLESIPFDLALSPSLHTIKVTHARDYGPGQVALEMLAKEIAAEHESQCGNSNLQVFIKSDY